LTSGNAQSNATEILGRELERLLTSAAGCVIYDQLARVVVEWQEVEREVEHSYRSLLRLLVEEFAVDPSSERVLALSARLIQARHRSGAPVVPMTPGLRHAELVTKLAADAELQPLLEVLTERLGPQPAESPPSPPPVSSPGPVRGSAVGSAIAEGDAATQPVAEQRVNVAYRQHLDRQRDEIGKLRASLSQNVHAALAQGREFSQLLQMGRDALTQAESVHEVTTLRQILLGGIEELLHGQRQLTEKLSSSEDMLQVIETDNTHLQDELHKVRQLSQTDDSTGLPNQRAFARHLEDEMTRAHRYRTTLTLAMIELDAQAAAGGVRITGERLLRCYAEQVLSIFRHHDVVARYGAEQFAVLLPTTSIDGARAALRKAQNRAAQSVCEFEGERVPLPGISCGLAIYRPGDTGALLIERAQRALVRARQLGHNRIEVDPPDLDRSRGEPSDQQPDKDRG